MKSPRTAAIGLVAAAALLLTGCGSSTDESGTGPDATWSRSRADAETQPTRHSGDSADDPAIWVNQQDPAQSLIIGNDKQGALETYDLDGTLVQRIEAPTKFWGNVDVRQDVHLATGPTDMVAAANERAPPVRRGPDHPEALPDHGRTAGALDTGGGEGRCLYRQARTATWPSSWCFISGRVLQLRPRGRRLGPPLPEGVRDFEVGPRPRAAWSTTRTGRSTSARRTTGIWRYAADPPRARSACLVDEVIVRRATYSPTSRASPWSTTAVGAAW